jgi:tRNA-2-methylthio-N6-dimethylallyladenosine synthase
MAGRYHIKTFGCQMNEYDSARMADVLSAQVGLSATDDPAQADLLLMNTCSVREKAQDKVYSLLGEWRALKQQRPELIIGVGGCVASQEGEAITARAPYVDLVFGPQTLHRLPQMIAELRRHGRAVIDLSFPAIEKFDALPEPRAAGARAYVSVMEGCSKYCSFCVVPYTRGNEVSRGFDSVLEEVRALARQGVSEIVLLGQNVNAYAGAMADGAIVDLSTLMHHVASIAGIERIRFTTSHPLEFTDSLIEAYAHLPQLANHLHLPVQSGSDRILALMKRGYTVLEYKERVRCGSWPMPVSISPSAFSIAAVPEPPRHRCRMKCRSRSSRNGCDGCRRCSMRRRWRSAAAWSAACSACWWSAPPGREPPIWPAAPRTTAGSIFPAPHRCCSGSWA